MPLSTRSQSAKINETMKLLMEMIQEMKANRDSKFEEIKASQEQMKASQVSKLEYLKASQDTEFCLVCLAYPTAPQDIREQMAILRKRP